MKTIYIASLLLFLAACATRYQPQGMTGGFSSTQLDANVFQVTFKGNGNTSPERANDFTLLRSAELALANGFQYFTIIDSQRYSKDSTYTTPSTATTNINANTNGIANSYGNNTNYSSHTQGTATTTVSGGQTYTISKPRTSNTIVCFKEKPDGFSYNAQFIANSLREKYGLDSPNE